MTARRYAEGTDVPIERSRVELETLLRNHGAWQITIGWDYDAQRGAVVFRLRDRFVRLTVQVPPRTAFAKDDKGKPRTAEQVTRLVHAEERRKWRAMLLLCKAKLETISGGDSTFEREFLADILLGDGSTVGDIAPAQIAEAYASGAPTMRLLGSG